MPDAVDVNLDIGEMVLKIDHSVVDQKIEYTKIDRLAFFKEPVKKLFRVVIIRTIEVHVKGKEEPYMISSAKISDFDQVEYYLRQMAEKYKISIDDIK
ncbi:MAG TPA: hypothetical protein VGE40_01695 [Bacilli bacterium]